MPVYTCKACLYTFAADNIPERCPIVARRLSVDGKTPVRDYPAVPPATNTKRFRRKLRKRKPPPEKRVWRLTETSKRPSRHSRQDSLSFYTLCFHGKNALTRRFRLSSQ